MGASVIPSLALILVVKVLGRGGHIQWACGKPWYWKRPLLPEDKSTHTHSAKSVGDSGPELLIEHKPHISPA